MAAAQEQQQQLQQQQRQRQLQQDLEAEQLQQQLLPLMMFESIASQGCNTSASQDCASAAPTAPQGHASSGTYALFDSASLMAPLNEAAMAAGASAGVNTTHSNSILSGRHITSSGTLKPCEVTGFLSGALGHVSLDGAEGYLPMTTLAAGGMGNTCQGIGAGFGVCAVSSGQAQVAGEAVTVDVPLSDCSAGQLALHFSHISRLSGAKLQLTSTAEGGTLLQLCGSEAEVEVARNIVQLLSSA
jgi:hypothetical protein